LDAHFPLSHKLTLVFPCLLKSLSLLISSLLSTPLTDIWQGGKRGF